MPTYEFRCTECEYTGEEFIRLSEYDETVLKCPNCDSENYQRYFSTPPMMRIGGENSDRQIDAMRRSFNERFVKKELDDVRHKHGLAIDDSLRGGAVGKIKKEIVSND